jgi:hypothetical protein
VTDVSGFTVGDCGAVKLLISLTEHEPPRGTVAVEGGKPIAFSGWLGLVHLLGGVVDSAILDDVSGASLHVGMGRVPAGGVAKATGTVSADPVTPAPILESREG